MEKVKIIKHPLIEHKLTRMRDVNTGSTEFRYLLRELSSLMAFEVTRNIEAQEIEVTTPLSVQARGSRVKHSEIVLIPILRAGIGMVDGVLEIIPQARVGHIGMYREPDTLKAVQYYKKLPANISDCQMVLLIDPMLATGHTMAAALKSSRRAGAKNLSIMCLVAAPEGIEEVRKDFPDIDIYTAAIDDHLDGHGYIIPGLGDAGDRIFGTK
ncbi:MAG: uracil phosphoribosyltransferase [Elusimicrobiota bacterium]|nr:uracil phosphoribosyltransferase [Elusimicrobiota bacterium]